MSKSEPEGYYYPFGDMLSPDTRVYLHKAFKLAQRALFIAAWASSLEEVRKAKNLANDALYMLGDPDKRDPDYILNAAIITQFDNALRVLLKIDTEVHRLGYDIMHFMHVTCQTVLAELPKLDTRSFFYTENIYYDPFEDTSSGASSSKRRNKGQKQGAKQDWRGTNNLWIDERDANGKYIYYLIGSDRERRNFNQDNELVERRSDGNWHVNVKENDGTYGRQGEMLYTENLRLLYGMPEYTKIQKDIINQWRLRRQEEAQRDAQTQGAVSYSLLDLLNHQQQQGMQGSSGAPSWYTGSSSHRTGRGAYKSRRVKIPRQRRKTNRKNRKNKTIRKNKTN